VLVVEDDPGIAAGLTRGLRLAGFRVDQARDGAVARERIASAELDVIVLDLGLPVVSGVKLLEELQGRDHAPVIVLTARTELSDRLRCFQLGAVDFLAKPFFLDELVARIRARLAPAVATRPFLRWADVELDPDARQVHVAGALVELTRNEHDLLVYLVQRRGRAVPRDQLAERALAGAQVPEARTIDSHVARLRKKLGPAGGTAIATVWGIGYRFDPDRPAA
jgi:DNA-binding response OmpR family regulator